MSDHPDLGPPEGLARSGLALGPGDLPAYAPSWAALRDAVDENPFMDAAVELLKAAGTVATYCAAVVHETPMPRDDAIRCGLLVRAAKLARALVRDACRDDGELQIGLSRMLLETLANLKYLCADGTGERHQSFVCDSLISEREFLKTITTRVATGDGTPLPVEDRMLRSIHAAAAAAGLSLDEVPGRPQNGWPSALDRVSTAFHPTAYLGFRAGSDALHGGWYDLLRSHLKQVEDGFESDFVGVRVRPQALLGATFMLCDVTLSYLDRRPDDERRLLAPALTELLGTAVRVDEEHETYLQRPVNGSAGAEGPA